MPLCFFISSYTALQGLHEAQNVGLSGMRSDPFRRNSEVVVNVSVLYDTLETSGEKFMRPGVFSNVFCVHFHFENKSKVIRNVSVPYRTIYYPTRNTL